MWFCNEPVIVQGVALPLVQEEAGLNTDGRIDVFTLHLYDTVASRCKAKVNLGVGWNAVH